MGKLASLGPEATWEDVRELAEIACGRADSMTAGVINLLALSALAAAAFWTLRGEGLCAGALMEAADLLEQGTSSSTDGGYLVLDSIMLGAGSAEAGEPESLASACADAPEGRVSRGMLGAVAAYRTASRACEPDGLAVCAWAAAARLRRAAGALGD